MYIYKGYICDELLLSKLNFENGLFLKICQSISKINYFEVLIYFKPKKSKVKI